MTDPFPFAGWRLRYWTSEPSPGWPLRVARELRAALPGAVVLVEPDPGADALAITSPEGAPAATIATTRGLACAAVERATRAGLL